MEDALMKVEKVELIPETHREIPDSDFSSLGAAGSAFRQFAQSIGRPGGEGIYRLTFPHGFSDMTLSKFKNENAYMGSGLVEGSFKQARLNQISADPTQMFIAMALMSIQSKLNEIGEMQREMFDFMLDVEETKLTANLNTLNKMIDDYKLNSANQVFINQLLAQVGNIKREVSHGEELYKKQIEKIIATEDTLHVVSSANDLVNKLRRNLRDYHLAYYVRSYAEFVEVFLIRNFTEENLKHIRERFISEKDAYDEVYSESYKWSEKYLRSAIGQKVAAPVLKGIDEVYEKGLSHLPFHLDRFFKADADKYVPIETQLEQISKDEDSGTEAFADSIKQMEFIQKEPVEMYLEGEKVYIANGKEEK